MPTVSRLAADLSVSSCLLAATLLAGVAHADGFRGLEDPVGMKDTPWLVASPDFKAGKGGGGGAGEGGVAGGCPQVQSTHTNASFEGGQYIVQAGFAEGEVAACSYTLSPGDFPLRLDLCEMIFATSGSSVTTTTKWSVLVWQGTPANGTLVYAYSSNGVDVPHLVIPPGTNGTNIQFGIDPGDPEQMILQDDGSHTFSIGFRIDDHNNQTSNPCIIAPPASSNAFPTTDVGGLQAPSQNWIFALDCGVLGCPAGWRTFAQMPTGCRPSGDWVMRASWTPINCETPGACCLPNGTCQVLAESSCAVQGGTFNGEGTACTGSSCSADICPCCFPATGGCLTLPPTSCAQAGGIAGPTGLSCSGYVCFPVGACCLPNGDCAGPMSPGDCAALGGVFQGNGTACTAGLCPEPLGAACFPTGFCLQLTEAQAQASGAVWAGPGTTCTDANQNGVPDGCESSNPADLDGDGVVGAQDLAILLGAWGQGAGPADLDGDGQVSAADLAILLDNWG